MGFAILPLTIVTALALFLSVLGVFNRQHDVVQQALVASPVRAIMAGVAIAAAVFGIVIGLLSAGLPPLSIAGLVVAAAVVLAAILGVASVARLLGERVIGLKRSESSPIFQTSGGTVLLAAVMGTPFVGWFLITPGVVAAGLGAVALTLWRRRFGPRPREGRRMAKRGP